MSESVYAGLTSQTIDIFLADSSSTTGGGLTGLAYNSSGLTCYYRKGATGSATSISLATQSVGGAWSSGGFVEIDSTNMPGVYRLDIPNAVVDSAGFVTIFIQGAENLVPTALRVDCRPLPADIKQILTDSQSATDLKSLVDTDFESRTLPSGDYFNWSEDSDLSSIESYIDGRTVPSGDYYNPSEDSVNIGSILGTSLTESNTGDLSNNVSQFFDVNPTTTNTVDDVGGSSLTVQNIVDGVWDENINNHLSTNSAGETLKYSNYVVESGTVEEYSSPLSTVFTSNLSPGTSNYYVDTLLSFISGSLSGQSRPVKEFLNTAGLFSFDEGFTSAPSSGDVFIIERSHIHSTTQLAREVWGWENESPIAGTYGYKLLDIPNNSEFNAKTLPSGDYFQWEDADFTDLENYIEGRTLPSGDYNSGSSGGDATSANQDIIISLLNYESGVVDNIYEDTNELQQNQGQWLTVDISGLATTTQLNSRTLPSGEYFNSSEDDVNVDFSSLTTLIQDIPTNSEFNARTLPSGDYFQWTDADFTTLESYIQERTLPSGDYFNSTEDVVTADFSSLTTLIQDIPTNNEFNARTLPSGDYFNPSEDNITVDNSSLETLITNRTLPSGDYFNVSEDEITVDLSSITALLNDIPTNSEFQARTLPSGEYLSSNDIGDLVIETEGNYTIQQALSIMLSVLAGQSSGSGLIFKTPNGNATRLIAVVDEDRNRTSMTVNPS